MSLCKGLVAKQIVTTKVVAELLQEAEDIGDAVDCWEVERVLLAVKHGCGVKQTGPVRQLVAQRRAKQEEAGPLLASGLPGYTEVNGAQVSFLPSSPSPEGLIFASNSKGFAIMGVARPDLLHLWLWNNSTQPVKQL